MTTETSKSDKPQKEEVNLLNYIITLLFHLNITDIVLAVAAALPSQVTSRCGWWVANNGTKIRPVTLSHLSLIAFYQLLTLQYSRCTV